MPRELTKRWIVVLRRKRAQSTSSLFAPCWIYLWDARRFAIPCVVALPEVETCLEHLKKETRRFL